MNALDELENKVQKVADSRLAEVLEQLFGQLEKRGCPRHTTILPMYVRAKINLTKARRDAKFETKCFGGSFEARLRNYDEAIERAATLRKDLYETPCHCSGETR